MAGFIESHELFAPAGQVLLAVSGGADSTALLYVMAALRQRDVVKCELICAHINHQLRGAEADGDERFVLEQCDKLGIDVVRRRVDVRGYAKRRRVSIETAGRELRIGSLIEIARERGCGCVVTGHQRDDNAETVLQRLIRGTGIRGLGGIWPVRELGGVRFVRPMLCARREEIVEYLNERGLGWRQDGTNAELGYRRNFIRHRLMPALASESKGSVVELLSVLSERAREYYGRVCERAEEVWAEAANCDGGRAAIKLEAFNGEPEPVKIELIRRCLKEMGSGEGNVTEEHYRRTIELAGHGERGGRIELAGGFGVLRDYGQLVFGRAGALSKKEKSGGKVELKVPGRTEFGRLVIDASVCEYDHEELKDFKAGKMEGVEWFDYDRLVFPLVVRQRREGDRFRPLGLGGEKKIGKFLTSAKVGEEIRRKVVVVSDKDKVIWVWPVRMSEQARVDEATRKVLRLRITNAGRSG